MASITSANSIVMISIASVYTTPQQLQGFAADDIFSTDTMEIAETMMGVDGRLSAGYVFVPVKWSISLQADSPSNAIFDNWRAAQVSAGDVYFASATVNLPSLGKTYDLVNGVLTSYPPIPDAGKTLKPRKFGLTWESVTPANM